MIVKLCRRQIFELLADRWRGLTRLSRGIPAFAHIVYEGLATLGVQWAMISRTPRVRPRLGDLIGVAALRILDYDWLMYELQRDLQPDGSLIVGSYILELFDQEADDRASLHQTLPRALR